MDFEPIWQRILENQDKVFKTRSNLDMIYSLQLGDKIKTSRAKERLPKKNFIKVRDALLAGEKPVNINKVIRGSYYIVAILEDDRIKGII